MSLKVPKFDFADGPPAKPAKVANSELAERNFSSFSDFSYDGVTENNFSPPLVKPPTQPQERVLTCHECDHFRPAVNSPNPTQAWGHCKKRDKGRYGVATACEAILNLPGAQGETNCSKAGLGEGRCSRDCS
jgi:hypothetical protein